MWADTTAHPGSSDHLPCVLASPVSCRCHFVVRWVGVPADNAHSGRLGLAVEVPLLAALAGFGIAAWRDARGRRRQPGFLFLTGLLGFVIVAAEVVLWM